MSAATSSRALALALVAALSGCTLVMQGTTQNVTFTSEPPGATVTVGGQTAVTPATLELPKDDYQVQFKRAGYEEASVDLKRKMSTWFIGSLVMGVIASSVDIATGAWKEFETTEVAVTLQPLPDTTQELPVSVSSEPAGADILIAGRSYGVTPKDLRLPWPPGEPEKEVTLRLAGYQPKKVALLRGEKQLRAALEALPVPVTLKISSTPDKAEVRVDGRPQGRTPIPVDLTWKPGDKPRTVELALEGYHPEKREITRDSKDVHVDFRELVEELVLPLKIEPAGAKVVVDGKPLPEGTKSVKLAWSLSSQKHVLLLSQPGYATKTVEVLRAAAEKPLEVRLAPALPGNN